MSRDVIRFLETIESLKVILPKSLNYVAVDRVIYIG